MSSDSTALTINPNQQLPRADEKNQQVKLYQNYQLICSERHPTTHPQHSHQSILPCNLWSDEDHVKELAKGLHTEFVERVGELDDFWSDWDTTNQAVDHQSQYQTIHHQSPLSTHSFLGPSSSHPSVTIVSENQTRSIRYSDPDYRIRTLDNVNLHTRSLPRSSLSIQRRHKRDLIYVPSDDDSGPIILITKNHLPRSAQSERLTTTTAAKKYNIIDPLWPKQWHLVNDILPHHDQ
ncbi:hypothetical protein BY996DRAFT_6463244, partial [Phakopsora pachyrhizi]